eukprot:9492132-Pyramimonas_sp.AAC.2
MVCAACPEQEESCSSESFNLCAERVRVCRKRAVQRSIAANVSFCIQQWRGCIPLSVLRTGNASCVASRECESSASASSLINSLHASGSSYKAGSCWTMCGADRSCTCPEGGSMTSALAA